MIRYRIKEYIKNRNYLRTIRQKGVIIGKNAHIRRDCVFEGNNYIDGEVFASSFGYGSYVHKYSMLVNVKVGRFTSIGEFVNMKLYDHPVQMVSTSPAFYRKDSTLRSFVKENTFEDMKLDEDGFSIRIGSDVWIGSGASIVSGVTIGDGAVIAAGAVVTKDVEPYEIVGGVPAKRIRYRFPEEIREGLVASRWWEKDPEWLSKHGEYFKDPETFLGKQGETKR
ncbi:MAG: CatB-related O-acetyltransferase [Lachnospiraceae bacterium]|nr:CatB-related O-acetyltransferase [Lachnospiraceae bacterium]